MKRSLYALTSIFKAESPFYYRRPLILWQQTVVYACDQRTPTPLRAHSDSVDYGGDGITVVVGAMVAGTRSPVASFERHPDHAR